METIKIDEKTYLELIRIKDKYIEAMAEKYPTFKKLVDIEGKMWEINSTWTYDHVAQTMIDKLIEESLKVQEELVKEGHQELINLVR